MTQSPVRVLDARYPDRAIFDTALSHAQLRAVAAGEFGESLRLYRPGDVLLFSLLDAKRPGFSEAVRLARAAGFEPVLRLGGGQAAVFHTETLAFAWATPHASSQTGIRERFCNVAGRISRALQNLGIEASVGEVPGEYCPGEHSVGARGRVKLVGISQRVIRGAAHLGGVIVVDGADRVRDVLVPIYEALGLQWDPASVGSVADEAPGIGVAEVEAALLAELLSGRERQACSPSTELLARAEELHPFHQVERAGRAGVAQAARAAARQPGPSPAASRSADKTLRIDS